MDSKNKEFEIIRKGILSLAQDKDIHVDFGDFNVTLGNNGLYYLALKAKVVCMDSCVSPDECDCARMFPNSMSFKTALEVVDFIKLNLFNQQAEYRVVDEMA